MELASKAAGTCNNTIMDVDNPVVLLDTAGAVLVVCLPLTRCLDTATIGYCGIGCGGIRPPYQDEGAEAI